MTSVAPQLDGPDSSHLPHSPRLARAGAASLLGAIVVGAALIGVAMGLYPGGTAAEPHALGHSFWLNYLCDLTNDLTPDGRPNVRGAEAARAGMLVLSLGLALFWLILPTLLRARPRTSLAIHVSGCLSAVGLAAVPYAGGAWHAPTILLTAVPGLVASSAGFGCLVRQGRRLDLLVAMAAILAGVTDAVLYATKVTGRLPETSPTVPLVQRLAVLSLLAWMGLVGWSVLIKQTSGAPMPKGDARRRGPHSRMTPTRRMTPSLPEDDATLIRRPS